MVASAAWALRHLSYLAPGLVLPPTMKRVYVVPVFCLPLFTSSIFLPLSLSLSHIHTLTFFFDLLLANIVVDAALSNITPVPARYPALETVTETHQAYAALSTLAAVARPLLWAENYTGGAKHLVPLLQLTLPGIDPNDGNKTQVRLCVLVCLTLPPSP